MTQGNLFAGEVPTFTAIEIFHDDDDCLPNRLAVWRSPEDRPAPHPIRRITIEWLGWTETTTTDVARWSSAAMQWRWGWPRKDER